MKRARKLNPIVFWLYYALIKIVSLAPLRILYLASEFAFLILFHVVKYRRNVVSANIERSFPNASEAFVQSTAKAFYRHFCDVFIEIFKIHGTSAAKSRKRLTLTNPELLEQLSNQGRNVVCATGHYGNWEYAPFLAPRIPFKMAAVYATQSNPYSNELVRRSRVRFGCEVVESKQTVRYALSEKSKQKPFFLYMVADQSPTGDQVCWTEFLNQQTAFFRGVEKIAKKTDCCVLYAHLNKVKRGHYAMTLSVLSENPSVESEDAIVKRYAAALEKTIQHDPTLWLWSHKRWKRKPPTAAS